MGKGRVTALLLAVVVIGLALMRTATAGRHDENLTQRVRVPRGPRAWLKCDTRRPYAGRTICLK